MSDSSPLGATPDAPAGLETQRLRAALAHRLFDTEQILQIGRFRVCDRLGQGGMGTVFLAEDPGLERRVAIKVLRLADADPEERARLQREAKTLARLAHPNVVVVHEVGEHEGDTYVAMEHVEGGDLAAWSRAHPPGDAARAKRALACSIEAGRGLAAAHEAGIVHRDFKPSNVLVGRDGRVRVADFGLARETHAAGEPADRERGSSSGSGSTAPDTGSATAVGAGTPAYMAPEQHAGTRVDARSDQFAFCVATWEVLAGVRPWPGIAALADGPPAAPPRGLGVPPHVWRALRRGLSHDAEERYPTMEALLADLEHDPRRRRRWAGAAAIAVVTVVGAMAWIRDRDAHRCDDAGAAIEAVWPGSARDAARESFEASGLAFASASWQRVQARLDAHADAWSSAAVEACRARPSDSEAALAAGDLVAACLELRRGELEALAQLLSTADRDLVLRGVETAAALPDLEICGDPERIRIEIPSAPDPTTTAAVTDLRIELGRARIERAAGRVQQARDRLDAAQTRADALGYGPLSAEVTLDRGLVLVQTGPDTAAGETLEAAHWQGLEHHHDAVAASAARALVDHEASRGRLDVAERWWQAAEVVSRRARLDASSEAHLFEVHARLLGAQGDYRGAEEALRAAIERHGDRRLPRAETRRNLVVTLAKQSRFADALTEQTLAIEELESELGTDHVVLAAPWNNLANLYIDLRREAEAEAPAMRSLELRRATFGDDHPSVASSWQTLGRVAYARRELPQARERFERALAIAKAAKDPGDPLVTRASSSLAAALVDLGEPERALEIHRELLEIYRRQRGPEHPDTGMGQRHIGWCLFELGRFREAIDALQEAEAILVAALGDRHGAVLDVRRLRARALAGDGRRAEARALLVEQIERAGDEPDAAPELDDMREDLAKLDAPE